MKTLDRQLEKKYFEDGQLWVEIPHQDGLIHGIMKEYYNDGHIHNIIPFRDGSPNGLAKSYSNNGRLKHQVYWEGGKIVNTSLVA